MHKIKLIPKVKWLRGGGVTPKIYKGEEDADIPNYSKHLSRRAWRRKAKETLNDYIQDYTNQIKEAGSMEDLNNIYQDALRTASTLGYRQGRKLISTIQPALQGAIRQGGFSYSPERQPSAQDYMRWEEYDPDERIRAHSVENSAIKLTPISRVTERPFSTDKQDWYTVQWGDTLSEIARHYGVTVQQLMDWNKDIIKKANGVKANTKIRITPPLKSTVSITGDDTVVEFPSAEDLILTKKIRSNPVYVKAHPERDTYPYQYTPLSTGDYTGADGTTPYATYIIKKGDTLYKLAKDWNIPLDVLLYMNDLSTAAANQLHPGDTILIPTPALVSEAADINSPGLAVGDQVVVGSDNTQGYISNISEGNDSIHVTYTIPKDVSPRDSIFTVPLDSSANIRRLNIENVDSLRTRFGFIPVEPPAGDDAGDE